MKSRLRTSVLALLLSGGWALHAQPLTRTAVDGRVISRADDGKTITLRPGERFVIDLGAGYGWTVDIGDQGVIERVRNVMVMSGAQGMYEAENRGETAVTASGMPECIAATPPCEPRTVSFRVHVKVHGP
jgi:hypothetical protein